MKAKFTCWKGLGVIVSVTAGLALIGCGQDETPVEENNAAVEAAAEDPHAGHQMGGDAHDMEALPVEKRVAFMSGHVEAGLALYRAGAPDQAAKHLLHPVSETHQAERAGIDALGFKADVFESVSKALDEGRDATEIEPMLQAAEDNMAVLQKNAGGDLVEIITYLMATVDEEYAIGVKDGAITDPGEFQDAYGFSVVALKTAKRLEGPTGTAAVAQLEALVALWPEGGPLADSTPTAVAQVTGKTAEVVKALSASE